jgi:hypothetical protein
MNFDHCESMPGGEGRGKRYVPICMSLVLCVFLWLPSARGQTPTSVPSTQRSQRPTVQSHPQNPELWDVEQMMEDAVLQISRRYNLNRAQENYTKLLLAGRVREFLDKHEKDVRELLKESIDLQLHPEKRSTEVYKKWAERAAPIYEEAKKAILDGNEEWREILNEDQKKLHDSDMAQMKTNFTQISQVMDQWKAGKGPSLSGGGPTEGSVSDRPPMVEHRLIEDHWQAYVTIFIQAYHLDEKQANAAKAKIHTEFLDQARAYRERHKTEFDRIEAELKNPSKDPARPLKPPELIRKKGDLEEPIRKMFVAMNERLNELLRVEQRAGVDADKKKQLDTWYRTLAGERSQKRATSGSAAQRPDASTPTTSSAPAGVKSASQKSEEAGPPKEPTTQPTTGPDKKVETPSPAAKTEDRPARRPPDTQTARENPASKPSD